ncbi:MAG: HEAT repeat domain-containing protein [Planctomycetes bacterium]|nr:HEAT repeat domain-containing protein [Planctomycetota bacterium]
MAPTVEALNGAFEALKEYDWGKDVDALKPIEDAVAASSRNAGARKDLEVRLCAVIESGASRAARAYALNQLSIAGTASCAAAVARLLPDPELSHMARYVLERIQGEKPLAALRQSLARVSGLQKVGVINSLGARRDPQAFGALVPLLTDGDEAIACAAAAALGSIGTPEAAAALGGCQGKGSARFARIAADAYLTCAERLLAAGKKVEALAIYEALLAPGQPDSIRRAAQVGIDAASPAR